MKAYTLFFASTVFLAPGAAASPKRSEGYSEAREQTLIVATDLALQKKNKYNKVRKHILIVSTALRSKKRIKYSKVREQTLIVSTALALQK